MKILGLDTTAESCSVALWHDGKVSSQLESTPRTHTRRLMPMIKDLLRKEGLVPGDLDAVAFGRGPGSFTGLRIAAGVTQGLAFGLGRPVVPVSSLAACALQAWLQHQASHVAVAFDARMNEVYWCCYEITEGRLGQVGDERVCPPEVLALPPGEQAWFGAGDGWTLSERMPAELMAGMAGHDAALVPTADSIVRLAARDFEEGVRVDAGDAAPVYLRDSVAWQKLPGR